MIADEPAFWATIPEHQRDRVMIAAKAMCSHQDRKEEDDGADPYCPDCDTPNGASCMAFGLYGDMAFAAVKALEEHMIRRLLTELQAEAE